MSYQLVQRVLPPSAVEHAVCANLISNTQKSIITACRTSLYVYMVNEKQEEQRLRPTLLLVKEYHFEGTITGIESILPTEHEEEASSLTATRDTLDYLIVSFAEYKASILKYSPEMNELVTVSLHYFEKEEYKTFFACPAPVEHRIRADPAGRCALMPVGHEYVGLMPLDALRATMNHLLSSSFVIKYTDFDAGIKNVVDICLLHDYFEPTLAILYTPELTWTSRLPYCRDTMKIAWVSMDLESKKFVLLSKLEGLPFDCFRIISIPKPLGGLLILSNNALIHVDPSSTSYHLPVNVFYAAVTNEKSFNHAYAKLNLTLDGAHIAQMSSHRFLLVTKKGSLFMLSISQMGRSIHNMLLQPIGETETPSCLIRVDASRAFLGSRIGSASILFKLEFITSSSSSHSMMMDAEDEELYGVKRDDVVQPELPESPYLALATDAHLANTQIYVEDYIERVGPVEDYCIGFAPVEKIQWAHRVNQNALQIVGNHGRGRNGGLCIVQESIWPFIMTTFPMTACDEIWTIPIQSANTKSVPKDTDAMDHAFLIMSSSISTMILMTQEKEIRELEVSDFYLEGRTIGAGPLCLASLIVQVYSAGIITLDYHAKMVQKISFVEESAIRSCAIEDPYVALLTVDGGFILYQVDASTQQLSLVPIPADIHNQSAVVMTIFKDTCHHFLSDEAHHYLAIDTASGVLEIYELPSFKSVFSCPDFFDFPDILLSYAKQTEPEGITQDITELLFKMSSLNDLYLMVRSSLGDLTIYQFYRAASSQQPLFSKIYHSVFLRDTSTDASQRGLSTRFYSEAKQSRTLIPFTNVSGFSGVMVTGQHPHWLFFTLRSRLPSLIPMSVDGPVLCWSSFSSLLCPLGFIYINSTGHLRLAQLPKGFTPSMHSTQGVLLRKVVLGRTVRHVVCHGDSLTYAVTTVRSVPFLLPTEEHTMGMQDENRDNEKAAILERVSQGEEGANPLPTIEEWTVELLSPVTWETVDKAFLHQFEYVVCLATVNLDSKQTASGKKLHVAVGTAYLRGEDRATRGRILLFEVVDVVPDPSQPHSRNRMKLAYQEELKGPVLAVTTIFGYLLTSIGSKIIIHSFSDGESLNGVAFVDVNIYAHSVSVMKNFILVGDVYKSIWFLVFQEDPPKIVVLGKDFNELDVQSVEYLVDGNTLHLLVADRSLNIHAYSYSPTDGQSMSGQRLLHRGDYHYGSLVSKFSQCGAFTFSPNEKQIFSTFCSVEGELGHVVSIKEKQFRRLFALYQKLIHSTSNLGGLNHKAFRLAKCPSRQYLKRSKNILDGTYISSRYNNLSRGRQSIIAKNLGSTPEKLFATLGSAMTMSELL